MNVVIGKAGGQSWWWSDTKFMDCGTAPDPTPEPEPTPVSVLPLCGWSWFSNCPI